ncbi:CD63 antigen [Nilaparvata lugens]|uniref:CD63 antigen n=1 Tax=Nilaparvata lugens TaxID=108931 RepID=UPI00193D6C81|nr:CD63 antigen [Nilaparvata lugens]
MKGMDSKPYSTPGMRCIKYLLILFNLMFMITGLCIVIVGTSINEFYADYAHFLEDRFFSPSVWLVALGMIIFFIAFLGCLGALKESTCLVTVFTIILGLIFCVEFFVGVSGYIMQKKLAGMLVHSMNETMHDYKTDANARITIDRLQNELQCCGIIRPADWEGVLSPVEMDTIQVPESCCSRFLSDKRCIATHNRGCLPKLHFLIGESTLLLVATAISIAFMQLVGVLFAYSLGRMIRFQKQERERRKWEMRERLISSYTNNGLKGGDVGPVLYMTVSEPHRGPPPPPAPPLPPHTDQQ